MRNNIFNKIKNYFKGLTSKASDVSAKRFISLFVILLITYIVIRFTTEENAVTILIELIGFTVALLFGGVYENRNK